LRIGIDIMGSESSPVILYEAVLQAAQELPNVTFIVFATQAVADSILDSSLFTSSPARIILQIASEVIEMSDEPLVAFRQKKNSSLALGLRLLKKKYLDGFVSAGNTGALIAGATLTLPMLPGIRRPALLATLPTQTGEVAVIDVGGNVSSKAHHLVQFALMGAAYQRCYQGLASPKIGLLNIGEESKKGTSAVRLAYQLLEERSNADTSSEKKLNFIGNVEGREIFQGKVDVLVTDGFTGNILLKSSEGVSSFLIEQLKYAFKDVPKEYCESVLGYLRYNFDYQEYGGAIICGVDCVAIKCHGKSSVKGLLNGIKGAVALVQNEFIAQIKAQLEMQNLESPPKAPLKT
jgi:glycerol-3-phosphate acyltransferase PlsX